MYGEMKEALRKFKEKDYNESRRAYERTVENKRHTWQENEAEYINTLVREKEMKIIWQAVSNITRRKEPITSVDPHEWASYFHGLFSINNDRLLVGL
jgi:hypothetical protein